MTRERVRKLVAAILSWAPAVILAVASASVLATPIGAEPSPFRVRRAPDTSRKASRVEDGAPLLATLVDTHSPARVPLDAVSPTPERFEALLADPVLGSTHAIDPALLELTRKLARLHPLARIEIVSGFRSPRLNEALRKKGHHVASHSQHSLGHALDLRVIPDGEDAPLDPVLLAAEVRKLGWQGGVGVYVKPDDRFVHADVGPNRTWYGQ